jgi:hypothetical protein
MTAEALHIGGRAYEVKRRLNVGEVREIRKKNASILGLNKQVLAEATDADLTEITKTLLEKTDEQDEQVAEILQACLGLTDEQVSALEYIDAVLLFNELYEHSTIIKKT